jgi:hypothetical protein
MIGRTTLSTLTLTLVILFGPSSEVLHKERLTRPVTCFEMAPMKSTLAFFIDGFELMTGLRVIAGRALAKTLNCRTQDQCHGEKQNYPQF